MSKQSNQVYKSILCILLITALVYLEILLCVYLEDTPFPEGIINRANRIILSILAMGGIAAWSIPIAILYPIDTKSINKNK